MQIHCVSKNKTLDFMVEYLDNFLTNVAVKEFLKSVHICQFVRKLSKYSTIKISTTP